MVLLLRFLECLGVFGALHFPADQILNRLCPLLMFLCAAGMQHSTQLRTHSTHLLLSGDVHTKQENLPAICQHLFLLCLGFESVRRGASYIEVLHARPKVEKHLWWGRNVGCTSRFMSSWPKASLGSASAAVLLVGTELREFSVLMRFSSSAVW